MIVRELILDLGLKKEDFKIWKSYQAKLKFQSMTQKLS